MSGAPLTAAERARRDGLVRMLAVAWWLRKRVERARAAGQTIELSQQERFVADAPQAYLDFLGCECLALCRRSGVAIADLVDIEVAKMQLEAETAAGIRIN